MGGFYERVANSPEGKRRYRAVAADGTELTIERDGNSSQTAFDAERALVTHEWDGARVASDAGSAWRKKQESIPGSFRYADRGIGGFESLPAERQEAIRAALGRWTGDKPSTDDPYNVGTGPDKDSTRIAEPRVNTALRGAIPMTDSISRDIEALDEALQHSRTTRAMTVFRGFSNGEFVMPADWETRDMAGAEFSTPLYTTSSGDKEVAEAYVGNRPERGFGITVKVPKGSPAIAIADDVGGLDNEGEILMPRGMRLRVVKDRGFTGPSKMRWLEVEIVPKSAPPKPQRRAGAARARLRA